MIDPENPHEWPSGPSRLYDSVFPCPCRGQPEYKRMSLLRPLLIKSWHPFPNSLSSSVKNITSFTASSQVCSSSHLAKNQAALLKRKRRIKVAWAPIQDVGPKMRPFEGKPGELPTSFWRNCSRRLPCHQGSLRLSALQHTLPCFPQSGRWSTTTLDRWRVGVVQLMINGSERQKITRCWG